VQSKLRDQAKSLADRMKARQLEGAGDSFKSFVKDMEAAGAAARRIRTRFPSGRRKSSPPPGTK
jgi:hypothetical protein